MAITSVCGSLKNGQDASCNPPVRRFYQQAVLINKADIDTFTINKPSEADPTCKYSVEFSLKSGKTGYRFTGPEAGSSYKGYFDKSTSDLGFPQYKHNAQILIVGSDEESKCILDSLSKGRLIAVYQFTDGTVEVYGFEQGLTTGDYTYDVQEGGGGTAVVLSSLDNSPEGLVPLVYKSAVDGGESADFDSNFDNGAPSV